MSLEDIKALCVLPFQGNSLICREKFFYALDDFVQKFLVEKIPCDMFIDGSLLTEKPAPDDVDVLVSIDNDVVENLSQSQRILVDQATQTIYSVLDSFVFVYYSRGHDFFGSGLDAAVAGQHFGLEHSGVWLKGCAVLRLWETDVGRRIHR